MNGKNAWWNILFSWINCGQWICRYSKILSPWKQIPTSPSWTENTILSIWCCNVHYRHFMFLCWWQVLNEFEIFMKLLVNLHWIKNRTQFSVTGHYRIHVMVIFMRIWGQYKYLHWLMCHCNFIHDYKWMYTKSKQNVSFKYFHKCTLCHKNRNRKWKLLRKN